MKSAKRTSLNTPVRMPQVRGITRTGIIGFVVQDDLYDIPSTHYSDYFLNDCKRLLGCLNISHSNTRTLKRQYAGKITKRGHCGRRIITLSGVLFKEQQQSERMISCK